MVSQSPKIQPLHKTTPAKNTILLITICEMNWRMEG